MTTTDTNTDVNAGPSTPIPDGNEDRCLRQNLIGTSEVRKVTLLLFFSEF